MDFIGDVIDMECTGEVKRPERFRWRGREYRIVKILANWQDYSMPPGVKKRTFKMRRHRNYYHVETDTGDRFEIYFDRGVKQPDWVLLKELGRPPERRSPEDPAV